jgi:hypothetical protein
VTRAGVLAMSGAVLTFTECLKLRPRSTVRVRTPWPNHLARQPGGGVKHSESDLTNLKRKGRPGASGTNAKFRLAGSSRLPVSWSIVVGS